MIIQQTIEVSTPEMGATSPSEFTTSLQITKVSSNSRAAKVNIIPFIDTIITINGSSIKDAEQVKTEFYKWKQSAIKLEILNLFTMKTRVLELEKCLEGEVLGISVKLNQYQPFCMNSCITEIEQDSPFKDRLIPNEDYIIGIEGIFIPEEGIFFHKLYENRGKNVVFYVFNKPTHTVRTVDVCIKDDPESLLGCEFGSGLLFEVADSDIRVVFNQKDFEQERGASIVEVIKQNEELAKKTTEEEANSHEQNDQNKTEIFDQIKTEIPNVRAEISKVKETVLTDSAKTVSQTSVDVLNKPQNIPKPEKIHQNQPLPEITKTIESNVKQDTNTRPEQQYQQQIPASDSAHPKPIGVKTNDQNKTPVSEAKYSEASMAILEKARLAQQKRNAQQIDQNGSKKGNETNRVQQKIKEPILEKTIEQSLHNEKLNFPQQMSQNQDDRMDSSEHVKPEDEICLDEIQQADELQQQEAERNEQQQQDALRLKQEIERNEHLRELEEAQIEADRLAEEQLQTKIDQNNFQQQLSPQETPINLEGLNTAEIHEMPEEFFKDESPVENIEDPEIMEKTRVLRNSGNDDNADFDEIDERLHKTEHSFQDLQLFNQEDNQEIKYEPYQESSSPEQTDFLKELQTQSQLVDNLFTSSEKQPTLENKIEDANFPFHRKNFVNQEATGQNDAVADVFADNGDFDVENLEEAEEYTPVKSLSDPKHTNKSFEKLDSNEKSLSDTGFDECSDTIVDDGNSIIWKDESGHDLVLDKEEEKK
ncbi:Golgi reassembly stacking [Pseudoloma neurophilia]|uniref:Golgi reassembly stacking n=1 Tax=Pseudoloma neurophilia TaxID=146866 RepID=A0A0R0LXE1_9MICR|nr:Golgi reassembly stacking [Pseudoloma neurophilia]